MARRLAGAAESRDLLQVSPVGATSPALRDVSEAADTPGGQAEEDRGAMTGIFGVRLHLRHGVLQTDR